MLSKKEKAILKLRMRKDSRELCSQEVAERIWKEIEAKNRLKREHGSRLYRDNGRHMFKRVIFGRSDAYGCGLFERINIRTEPFKHKCVRCKRCLFL